MENNKKALIIVTIFGLIIAIIGGTLAYWRWQSSEAQKTVVNFTIEGDFSCAADGGGEITSGSINLIPTEVNDNTTGNYVKREVKVMPTINKDGKTIYMDLWLDIKSISANLSSSNNLMYILNTSGTDKDTGVITSGNFNGKSTGDKIELLSSKEYSATVTETYYLWIWLDAKETSSSTMNQSFSLSLNGSCADDNSVKPNAPELDDGMIPVVFDTSTGTVVKTVSSTDTSWYDYDNQEWANAVLVKESGTQTRAYYKANPGVTINQADILAYYVWIPRYKYQIWSTDSDSKTGKEQTIDIVFENKNSISTGTQVGEYITHPAFWWDNDSDGVREDGEELAGIWVGKFETTGTASSPTILPDVQSLTNQNVSTQFTIAQLLGGSTYGITTNADSHMMKNSEWGAAAYLSHSKYGVNREVYINNSRSHYTGRSGGNVGGSTPINGTYTDQTSTTQYNSYGYYTWDGYLLNYNTNTKSSTRDLTKVASTTGNITGIYDMSGGGNEYVMGVYANSDGQLLSGRSTSYNSGFTGLLGSAGDQYTGVDFPDSKYYDVYKASSGTTNGHALSETKRWYGDNAYFVAATGPWFARGGYYSDGSYAGMFSRYSYGGNAYNDIGFRAVLSQIGA